MSQRLDDPRLDLNLLRTLRALLATNNISRAARLLHISQPALSARLNRLRTLFGDPLFVAASSGRGVAPTPRALALRDELYEVLNRLDGMLKSGPAFDPATSRRTFTIAMHDNPAVMLAPDLVKQMIAMAPDVRLALVRPDPSQLGKALEEGGVDLAILPPTSADPGWKGRVLLTERLLTAQRNGHPRGTEPLDLDSFCALDHILISAHGGGFSGIVDDALAALGRSRRVVASISSYALAPLIVEATDSVCTLPARFLERFAGRLSVFDPPLVLAPTQLAAYWHERSHGDPAHQWLRMLVADLAQQASRFTA